MNPMVLMQLCHDLKEEAMEMSARVESLTAQIRVEAERVQQLEAQLASQNGTPEKIET